VSLCVYLNIHDLNPGNLAIIQSYRNTWKDRLTLSLYSAADRYPINIVRNRALQQVTTEFVILLDMDFVPDPGLYNYILNNYDLINDNTAPRAFVIPAFAYSPPGVPSNKIWTEVPFPESKAKLSEAVENELFKYEQWGEAQKDTNIPKWLKSDDLYPVYPGDWFEPYVLVNLKYVPFFDERYIYYGDDKTQWNNHLKWLGTEMWVIPNHYILHLPHKPNSWAGQERKQVGSILKKLRPEFAYELQMMREFSRKNPDLNRIL